MSIAGAADHDDLGHARERVRRGDALGDVELVRTTRRPTPLAIVLTWIVSSPSLVSPWMRPAAFGPMFSVSVLALLARQYAGPLERDFELEQRDPRELEAGLEEQDLDVGAQEELDRCR